MEYHLGHAYINGDFYLFVDTPGLNETGGNNADILREIGRFLGATRDSVIYAGVLYVHPVGVQFSNDCQRALEFLEHLCGLEYSPYILFVTTMWDELNQERAMKRHNENIKQIKEQKTKEYTVPPLIVQELRAHVPLPATTAGQYLRMIYSEASITKMLTYGAGYSAGTEGSEFPNLNRAKENESKGFDWIGSAINIVVHSIKFPFRMIQTFVTMLWDLIGILRTRVSIVRVMPYRFTDNGVEVCLTLLGGFSVIVGYERPGGFY
ncbi:hypothetical protein N7493_000970 [Penicillium malachiteum]|uniref:AIG1-type G domain-containing protein n=1 Tax=Penicillium malachiteum TaxID=1324776 RepID=A0AAD6HXC0_9EURO|nr:hypothetical protein N7493_000970 [Penicillium malachiteum]